MLKRVVILVSDPELSMLAEDWFDSRWAEVQIVESMKGLKAFSDWKPDLVIWEWGVSGQDQHPLLPLFLYPGAASKIVSLATGPEVIDMLINLGRMVDDFFILPIVETQVFKREINRYLWGQTHVSETLAQA